MLGTRLTMSTRSHLANKYDTTKIIVPQHSYDGPYCMKVKKDTKIECANLALKLPLEPEKNGQNGCLVSKIFLSLLHFLR